MVSEGNIVAIAGPLLKARLPFGSLGDLCTICRRGGRELVAQIVSFTDDLFLVAPFGRTDGISPGDLIRCAGRTPRMTVSPALLGRVLDPLGDPIDGRGPIASTCGVEARALIATPPHPLSRPPIETPLETGVRVIDGMCPLGYGQRVGLFASAGVGKSTLLGLLARRADVDVTVIALVGERGREVKEFLSEALGEGGLAKAVVIVSTSDEPPVRRRLAPFTATTVAEYFRDKGLRVLLLVDSLTRTARAIRDVSLSAGELPIRQGYTGSVYGELPQLIERAGTSSTGSITALYTMLSARRGEADPLSDEVKSLLDGHLVMAESIAERGIRPAIDPLQSLSRLASRLSGVREREDRSILIAALAKLERDKAVVLLGGTPDRELRAALHIEPSLIEFLNQPGDLLSLRNETQARMHELAANYREQLGTG